MPASMYYARKAQKVDEGFVPSGRRIYQAIMEDTRHILVCLERRLKSLSQQQFIFVTALDRCRQQNFEPTKRISTVAQVQNYHDVVSDNATDKRMFSMFLSLIRDLGEFRRTLVKVVNTKSDERLSHLFHKWKRLLEPRQDISDVRARFPNDQINHLSCDEAKNHFGGIISLIPVTMDCAREAVERIESTRACRGEAESRGKMYSDLFRGDIPDTVRSVDKFRPGRRRDSNSSTRQDTARNRQNGYTNRQKFPGCEGPGSPAISSPALSRSSSLMSVLRTPSQRSIRSRPTSSRQQQRQRPVTATNTYMAQAVQTTDSLERRRPATALKATQTPNYLATNLKPNPDRHNQSISESEMKKLLHSRQNAVSRPSWKP